MGLLDIAVGGGGGDYIEGFNGAFYRHEYQL